MYNLIKSLALLVLAAHFAGCATVQAPSKWVPDRKDLDVDAFGSYITVQVQHTPTTLVAVSGELIAIGQDSIYMMNEVRAISYAKSDIPAARIVFYNTSTTQYGTWSTLLCLGTISNGAYLLYTFPIALIAGIATTSGEAKRKNFYDYPLESWEFLRKYARFPQGLPPTVSLSDLRPKLLK